MNNEEKKVNNEELKEELNREGSAAEEKKAESAGTGDGDRTGEFKEAAEAEKLQNRKKPEKAAAQKARLQRKPQRRMKPSIQNI